ncbi:OLC1v1009460C1 [Oldenlandia corymbosa var. corymbosa]|uniref:OLC1v1009460C1 n=1 Tax=Oldenlandia corymbosa var. corymbosa TaxID=529605 RepID=A0AAV1DRF4_OLDCO|nr:OLC1v1009460C1 [Oldenlandia corymbosa var. corymbosa]
MTVKGGTSPACASCKYQRRKCSSDCILAPYFPANQAKAFQNAHRLFGVSNIMKILKQLNTLEQKEEAMKSIKYESDMRERYPVYGCAGIIHQLRQQLRLTIQELQHVYSQLAFYREQYLNNHQVVPASDYSPQSQLQLGINGSMDAPLVFQHHSAGNSSQDYEMPFVMDIPMLNENYGNGNDAVHHAAESIEHLGLAKPLLGVDNFYGQTDAYYDLMRNNNPVLNQVPVAADAEHTFGVNPEIRHLQDYENMEFNAAVDDRVSYIETKEASESSSRSSFPDFPESVEHVSNNELRNAAACFSLTSVN